MLLLILLVIFIMVLIFSLANLWRGFSLAEIILTWFLIVCADIVLVMEISGLLGVLNRPAFLLLIQFVLTLLVYAVNQVFKIGFPRFSLADISSNICKFFSRIWHNKLFSLSFLAVLAVYAFQAVLAVRFPQNLSDVLYNHLSRIGFWLQNGSLKHYIGFSQVGMFYPYNNSLLAALPIVFLKSDRLVAWVQYAAAIMTAITIYLLALQCGFRKKSSAVAALITLTYPIILFESITVQNDLLVACFSLIAFLFLTTGFSTGNKVYLVLSAVSLALALGTNQYAVFVLPGYLALLLYYIFTKKKQKLLLPWIGAAVGFVLLVGCYSYIQNIAYYQNPLGPGEFLTRVMHPASIRDLPQRIITSSSRLFAQFISCDGLTPQMESGCIKGREWVLSRILPKNIESDAYLYDTERFSLSEPYRLNAESAWFGPVSWLVILPAAAAALIYSIRKKKFEQLILVLSAAVFFLGISAVKHGWDPYQGRYLITAIVILQPFTAALFGTRKIAPRMVTGLVCTAAVLIMIYACLSNESLPTLAQSSVKRVHTWGVKNSLLIQKLAYKTLPLAKYDKDVWKMNDIEVKTLAEHNYYFPAVSLVEKYASPDVSLGIAVTRDMFFDYLFRGMQVSRKLTPLILDGEGVQSQDDFILIAPMVHYGLTDNYREIGQAKGWVLWQRYK